MAQVTEIAECGESCPSSIVNDNIKAAKLFDAFFHESDRVFHHAYVLDRVVRLSKSWPSSRSHLTAWITTALTPNPLTFSATSSALSLLLT